MASFFFRFLDTNGDGTGSIDANVAGTLGTPVNFSFTGIPGHKFLIQGNIA